MAALIDFEIALTRSVLLAWGMVSLLVMVPLLRGVPARGRVVLPLVFAAALMAVHLTPWNSRKVFLGDFRDIRPGMSLAEVDAIMAGYLRGTGWPHPDGTPGELRLADSVVFRHAKTGNYNSDWGVVRFADGRVTEATFLPD